VGKRGKERKKKILGGILKFARRGRKGGSGGRKNRTKPPHQKKKKKRKGKGKREAGRSSLKLVPSEIKGNRRKNR